MGQSLLRARSRSGWVGRLEGAVILVYLGIGLVVASALVLPAWGLMRLAGRRP